MSHQKTRILIVDDDADFTRLLAMALRESAGYDTREENDPAAALGAARDYRPDVILLDVVMPELDGGDVAGRLAGDHATRSIPVVFLTSLVESDEVALGGLLSGGRRFLPKPVSVAELTQCVGEAVRGGW